MPSLSGPPSLYFIFNVNAPAPQCPCCSSSSGCSQPRSNLPVQKGPPRVQASLSTFVSTCKILWETGAVDSRWPPATLVSQAPPGHSGDFQRPRAPHTEWPPPAPRPRAKTTWAPPRAACRAGKEPLGPLHQAPPFSLCHPS